jgi:acyl carrier protein
MPPGRWLICADRGGLADQLAARWSAAGAPPVVVESGTEFHRSEDDRYRLDPLQPEHFTRLLADAAARGIRWDGVLYLGGLDAGLTEETTPEALAAAVETGCGGALHLLQALLGTQPTAPPPLWLVTRGAHRVPGDEHPGDPAAGALWGLGRVLALEHPELWGGLVDLPAEPRPGDAETLLAHLAAPEGEDQTVLRGSRRLRARLAPLAEPPVAPPELRPDVTYLVTGGLGSLGLAVAAWMVERGARHLVLLGRSAPTAPAAAAIAELEAAGATVRVCRADVARRGELAAALDAALAGRPPLAGVIHGAGVVDDGVLMHLDRARLARVMAPKVQGAWNLHHLTAHRPLDFFVLFSSAATLLGSPGQGNYTAANAFLDGLATYRRSRGLPATSLCWGPWSQVGMAAELQTRSRRQWRPPGVEPLPPDQGLALLGRLLQGSSPQVGVLAVDWAEFLRHYGGPRLPPVLAGLAAAAGTAGPAEPELPRRLREAPAAVRRELLGEHLGRTVARVLGLPPAEAPEPQCGFFELGLDSLMAIELRNRLAADLGCPLPPTLTFQHPTLEALADHLLADVLELEATSGAGGPPVREAAPLDHLSEGELLALLAEELATPAKPASTEDRKP